MESKQLSVCYFGVNDKNASRNKMILNGLRDNNARIVDVSIFNPLTRLVYREDSSLYLNINRLLKKFKNLSVLFRQIEDIRSCDVIYVGYPGHFDVPFAYLVSRITRVPVVFDPVIPLSDAFSNVIELFSPVSTAAKLLFLVEKWIYSLPEVVFADTQLQADFFAEKYKIAKQKVKVLYLGADDSIYKSGLSRSVKKSTFNVVYYGLYNSTHGVEYILKAASYCRRDPQIRFLLVGQGKAYPDMVKLAKSLNLKNVYFYPDLNESNSSSMLQKADIFLGFLMNNSSLNRAIPNKVYQGLALGKAVITAQSEAVKSMFKHRQNIYTCKAADGLSLAKAVQTLKKDFKLRNKIAREGYRFYKHNFTSCAIARQLIAIIKETTGRYSQSEAGYKVIGGLNSSKS